MSREILLVRTGVANVASIQAAFSRLRTTTRFASCAAEVEDADAVVLPGVGAFGAAMSGLQESGLADVLRERITAGRKTLAVCLGLQLLCRRSEESPSVAGLAVLDVDVTRFEAARGVLVPQLGWNQIQSGPEARLLESGVVYFANSYRLTEVPRGWQAAMADHGGPFVAAVERGPVLACQFHPELSGAFGLALLSRWLMDQGEH